MRSRTFLYGLMFAVKALGVTRLVGIPRTCPLGGGRSPLALAQSGVKADYGTFCPTLITLYDFQQRKNDP